MKKKPRATFFCSIIFLYHRWWYVYSWYCVEQFCLVKANTVLQELYCSVSRKREHLNITRLLVFLICFCSNPPVWLWIMV